MPTIIDYPEVLRRMTEDGFRCLYHNSGAFGFAPELKPHIVGWIGPEDPTIRADARLHVIPVPPPHEQNLASMLVDSWRQRLPGAVWIMPVSHWAYELEFGNAGWLPGQLRQIGIDPVSLQGRNNGAAIEFSAGERLHAGQFVKSLLELLHGSDFTIAFPGYPVVCTVHHHKQLWWQTRDDALAASLKHVARGNPNPV